MFGQGGGQQGGFGFGTGGGGAKFGSGAGGEVKWGSAARSQQQQQGAGRAQAPKAGGSAFGRISSPPGASGFGGGRSGGQGAYQNNTQQGRAGRSPFGGGRGGPQKQQSPPQQQQQQQKRSPLLGKLGLVNKGLGYWSTGAAAGGQQQQQQQQGGRGGGRCGAAAAAAAAAAATAAGGGRGGAGRWGGRSSEHGGRTGGSSSSSRGGRQQYNPPQQYDGQGRGRGGGRSSNNWNRQQQQQQHQFGSGRGRGRTSDGGRGGGRSSGGRGGVFSRLGGPAYNDEDMAAAEWHEQEQQDGAAAADGQAWQEEEAWQGAEEDMQDMEAEEAWEVQGEEGQQQYDDDEAGGDEQQEYDADEAQGDEQGDEGYYGGEQEHADGAADADGVLLSEQQLEAAKAAALAAIPRFIGGSGAAKAAGAAAASGLAASKASKPPAPQGFRLKASSGAPPSPSYDTLEAAAASGGAAAARAARGGAGAAGGLHVEPRCHDMCPAAERQQRTADRQLHDFERIPGQEYATDAEHAIKKYTRSEAGGLPDPALLRTWPALQKTLVHLRRLMGQVGSSARTDLLEAHRFLWDRYRSVRKDITQTELAHKGTNQLLWVIAANEEMARFMILADAYLADKDKVNTAAKTAKAAAAATKRTAAPRITFNLEQFERDAEAAAAEAAAGAGGGFQPDPYDGHLNHQELTKTLLDLSALYREAGRMGVHCPHEAEFLSYYLILSRGTFGSFKASTANVVRLLNQMSAQVLASPHVQFALALSGALASTNYAQLLRLLEGAPLLLAAAGQVYVPRLRSQALVCLLRTGQPARSKASGRGVKQLPVELYASLLRFDDSSQALRFVMRHKEAGCSSLSVVDAADGTALLEVPSGELHTLQELREPPRHCLPWLLAKAGDATLPELVTQPCPLPDLAALGLVPGGQGVVRVPRPVVPCTSKPAGAATPWQAKVTSPPRQQQQQVSKQQQQQQAAFKILAKAGAAKQLPSHQQGSFQVPGQQQQQPLVSTAAAATSGGGKRARGSTDSLPSMMPPAAAAATATAVFGGIAGAAAAGMSSPSADGSTRVQSAGALAALAQQFAAQQQQQLALQQQQQQSGIGLAAFTGLSAIHQPQQQQQQQQQLGNTQQQQLQLQSQAAAAAIAAEQQRNAELARQLAERNAEIARERELRHRSDTELRLIKQEIELKSKCEDAARWMWLARWRSAAAAAKAARLQRQKEDQALAAADATLGRARKRRSLAAAAAAVCVTELELLQVQEERQGSPKRGARNGSSAAALADFSPAPVEQLIAGQLAAAPPQQQPACHSVPEQIYLPGLESSSSSLGGGSSSSKADAHCCPPASLVYKLLLISGYRDEEASMRPPLYQRRVANWLRHKFAPYRPPHKLLTGRLAATTTAAAGLAAADSQQQQAVLVPLGGEQQQQQTEGAQGTPMSAAAAAPAAAGRQVWRLGPHAELLLSKSLPLPGSEQQQLLVEVLDVIGSNLAAVPGSSSAGPAQVCAGAAGVMLLVSGPVPDEIEAAVRRLAAVLQCMAPAGAVQVPLVVLAASEPATQSDVESCLKAAMDAMMPADVYSRLSGGKVFCLGTGSNGASSSVSSPAAVLRDALVYAAQEAPQLPSMRHVNAAGHLLDCLTVLNLPQAKAAAPPGDVLAAYIAAHNMALSSMQQGLQEQLQSDAGRWGYPPAQSTGGVQPQQQLQLVMSQLAALQLPPPPLLQQQERPAAGASPSIEHPALLQLKQYLGSLSHGPAAEAAGGVAALLLDMRLPQQTAGRSSSWQQREQQQQQYNAAVSQLVVASCEQLLRQLQLKLPVGRLTIAAAALHWLNDQYWDQQQVLQRQQQQQHFHAGIGSQQKQKQKELLQLTGAAATSAVQVMHGGLLPGPGAAAAEAQHTALPHIMSTPLAQKIAGVAGYADGWQNGMSPAAAVGPAHTVAGTSGQQQSVSGSAQQRIQAELAAADKFLASTPGSWLKAVLAGRHLVCLAEPGFRLQQLLGGQFGL